MLQMITGYRVSQIVGTLAELEIPDRLANGPLSFDELAKAIGCDPESTYRLLRASASVDVVSAMDDGRFGLTPLGAILRSNVPGSMRECAIALTAPERAGSPITAASSGSENDVGGNHNPKCVVADKGDLDEHAHNRKAHHNERERKSKPHCASPLSRKNATNQVTAHAS
jgi:hypothetical protein